MSNGITLISGLPQNPPFVPQVEVRNNLAQHVRAITGQLMFYVQSHAPANFLVGHFYQLVGQNGFNNPAFTTLVQETVIIIDHIMSNQNPPPPFGKILEEYIPIIVIGAAASYATQAQAILNNPQVTQDIVNMAYSSAQQFNQLRQQSQNWFQGAKMQQYQQQAMYPGMPGYPQQPQMPYGQQPMMYQQPMMPQQMPAYGQMPMQQPAMAYAGQPQQPAYAMAQRPPVMNQQMMPGYPMQNGYQPQVIPPGVIPQQPGGPYQPQVAGGMFNPHAAAQAGYQQPMPYGFTPPTSGPRSGGLGAAIPGVNDQGQPTPPAATNANQPHYQPQPAYQQNSNVGQPPQPQQSVQQQYTQPAPAAAVSNIQQAPAAQAQTQPVMTAPTPSNNPVPATQSTSSNSLQSFIAGESTVYRIPNGSGFVRHPFVYERTSEYHVVKLNQNGEVIEQQVLDLGEQVQLSDHDTRQYFTARTKEDLVNPDLSRFTAALDKAATTMTAKDIMQKIASLTNEDEEELSRETATILRDALDNNLITVDKVFHKGAQHTVTPHFQFMSIVDESLGRKASNVAATFRSVVLQNWPMSGDEARLASKITASDDIYELHQLLSALVDRLPPMTKVPFVDWITDFVNTEIKRYFGLPWSMESFVLDMQELLDELVKTESIEFINEFVKHIHYRLTTTILYAYTPAELNEVCRADVIEESDSRYFARVDQIVLVPARSHDVPYTYNGRAGLILNTEYRSLTRLIDIALEAGGTHLAELQLVTQDGDILRIHPIINDNSYVLYKKMNLANAG